MPKTQPPRPIGQAKFIFCEAWYARMSTLRSAWNIFSTFFAWNYFIYFRIYSLFIFFSIFFFYCLFITSILGNQQKLQCLLFFHFYERRAIMWESVLKILCNFSFFSDTTYETLLHRRSGDLFEMKKKHFYSIWCWNYFLLFNR